MPDLPITSRISCFALALLSGLAGCECRTATDDSVPSDTQPVWEPASTVVVITIDSLSPRILMGQSWDWEVAPALHGFFDEAVVLPRVLSAAGVTRPALASMLTGLYPQQHGARTNTAELRDGTSLMRRFEDAGYHTFGFTSNQCPVIREGDVDEYYCTWNDELPEPHTLEDRDRLLVDELLGRLSTVAADEPIFVWLHLNNVHHPYMADRDVAEAFYGGEYEGFLNPSDDSMVAQVTLGGLDISADEQRYLEATYAAQLSATDAMIAELFGSLRDQGRYDDAVILLGADHGEELASRRDYAYFWHGCSPYNSVLQVVYAVRAPGRIQGGQELDGWVSITDMAPTIVDLVAAFSWSGERAGSSLVPYLTGGPEPEGPVFSGRGIDTALMIQDDHKYLISDVEEYTTCEPYSGTGLGYPGDLEELFDLAVDPDEDIDLADSDRPRAVAMHTTLCEWMVEVGWVPAEQADSNVLTLECAAWLCEVGSDLCEG